MNLPYTTIDSSSIYDPAEFIAKQEPTKLTRVEETINKLIEEEDGTSEQKRMKRKAQIKAMKPYIQQK